MHYFTSPTPLDPIFIRQFGLSVKREGAIGQFGTGLKYAIATVLRGGGTVRLRTQGETFEFGWRNHQARDHTFQVVTCNGEDLPFTTDLGKNWKPWMAFRELVCNAWDEGGDHYRERCDAATVIEVDWSEFDSLDLDRFFYRGEATPLAADNEVEIHDNPFRAGAVYYKGVLVSAIQGSPFHYVLRGEMWKAYLTEDRTVANTSMICSYVAYAVNEAEPQTLVEIWRKLLRAGSQELQYLLRPRPAAQAAFMSAYNSGALSGDKARDAVAKIEQAQPPKVREPSETEQRFLDRALALLGRGGIHLDAPIRIIEGQNKRTLALTDHTTIYITASSFEEGLRCIVKCLLEEHCHIAYDAEDETYAMQHALHEQWIKTFCHLTGEIV